MTNNEILRASLLDIIFEHRNKDYGAYALRRTYNHRMLIALGAAMSAILLFVLINELNKKDGPFVPAVKTNGGIEIRQIELPKEPDKPKEITKPPSKPVEQVATIKNVTINVKPDDQVKATTVPENESLAGKMILNETLDGTIDIDIVKPVENKVTQPGTDNTGEIAEQTTTFVPDQKDPEFPGGPEALKRFLAKNLNTPDQLEIDERKMVRIRFKVDKDGSVSTLEILNSGGDEFDREVMRVCRKMPRWKPAIQNGVNVPVSYVLPVIFIGTEQ